VRETAPVTTRLDTRLSAGVLVGDGGMGSLLNVRLPQLRFPEQANVDAPEAVLAAHVDFIRSGADVIQTNTYGANAVKLALHGWESRAEELNAAGAKIAREARDVSGRDVLIAGSVGPLGTSVELIAGDTSQGAALYAEQAAILEGRGADLIVLETFTSLEEVTAAAAAVRAQCGLPVIAQVTVQEDGETVTGASGAEIAGTLAPLGVAAVGINCSLGPQSALAGLRRLRETATVALTVQPNIGLPFYQDGRVLYPDGSDAYVAEFAAQALELGARLVGGCCGSQPHHIAAIRQAVDNRRPARYAFTGREPEPAADAPAREADSRLARLLRDGDWVTSVELDPPKGANLDRLLELVGLVEAAGVEFADVNDNPMARARMSSLMASALIQQRFSIETIPHLTPRDSTARGLESQLLGAYASGIRNVLAVTGDYPPPGDHGGSDAAYQLDSVGLVETVAALNRGTDRAGKVLDASTDFLIGVAVNPTADDAAHELERFHRKLAAGARFAMTQVLFDLEPLRRLIEQLGGVAPVPLLVGLWPVTSHALALRLHNEVPGITVPEPVLERLAQSEARAAAEGVAIARSLFEEARELVAGAYVVAPFGQLERVLDVLA
jgi:homocysteine S-methyltransferase